MARPKNDVERPHRLELRLSDEELAKLTLLRAIAEGGGMFGETQADVVRRLISASFARRPELHDLLEDETAEVKRQRRG